MLGSLKVRLLGDPVLRAKAKPVKTVGPVERMLITAMFETMQAHKGIGLAAPQVGISEQIFVVDTGKDAFAVVNPKIVRAYGSDIVEEGCLSIPNLHVDIKRAKTIEVEFIDELNRPVRAELAGLAARVFQHEYDHIQGRLILDYVPEPQRRKILKEVKEGVFFSQERKHERIGAGKV